MQKQCNIHLMTTAKIDNIGRNDFFSEISSKYWKTNLRFNWKSKENFLPKILREADFIVVDTDWCDSYDENINQLIESNALYEIMYAKSVHIENSAVIKNKNPKVILIAPKPDSQNTILDTIIDYYAATFNNAFKWIENQIEEMETQNGITTN